MLKVHTNDGLTAEVDMGDPRSFKEWLRKLHDPAFQATITGLTVVQRGVQYSLPRPEGFRDATLVAEPVEAGKGGERLVLALDDIRVSVMVHHGQRAARVSVARRWHRVFRPGED